VRLDEDGIGRVARVTQIVEQPTSSVIDLVREAAGRPKALLDVQEVRRRVHHVHVVVAAGRANVEVPDPVALMERSQNGMYCSLA